MNINNKIADEKAQHTENENYKEYKSMSSSRKKRKLKIKIGSKAKEFEAVKLQKVPYFAGKIDKNLELIDEKFGIFDPNNFDMNDFVNVVDFSQNPRSLDECAHNLDINQSWINCALYFGVDLATFWELHKSFEQKQKENEAMKGISSCVYI